GSAYTYAYATLGEFIAWIIGWDLILEYALGAATVAIGWSSYVVSFLKDFGIVITPAYAGAPFAHDAGAGTWHATRAVVNVPAMVAIAGISTLLVFGVRESARVNNVIVAIKLGHRRAVHRRDGVLRQHRKLGDGEQSFGQLHSAQYRTRTIRLKRRGARRRRRVLRLYRLRCGLDGGAGGEEPEARHADRHSRLARHLQRAVRRRRLRAHRDRAVRQAQRCRSDRGRHRRGGAELPRADHQI